MCLIVKEQRRRSGCSLIIASNGQNRISARKHLPFIHPVGTDNPRYSIHPFRFSLGGASPRGAALCPLIGPDVTAPRARPRNHDRLADAFFSNPLAFVTSLHGTSHFIIQLRDHRKGDGAANSICEGDAIISAVRVRLRSP